MSSTLETPTFTPGNLKSVERNSHKPVQFSTKIRSIASISEGPFGIQVVCHKPNLMKNGVADQCNASSKLEHALIHCVLGLFLLSSQVSCSKQ